MSGEQYSLEVGASFEQRYEVIEPLGRGGFGAVYKVRQLSTGQPVALKLMNVVDATNARREKRAARFLREAQLCARLRHPNIVQLIDSGRAADGCMYSVFGFAPGMNLAEVLKAEGALAPREAQHLMLQVLDALACAHADGIIHRDLKPSNIMVVPTGARRNALLLDLGIGAVLGADDAEDFRRLTDTNDVLGSPGYGAPEQWRGSDPSPATDLFSWALVFVECLTGRPVYGEGSASQALYRQLGPEPVPLPTALANHAIGVILAKALAKDQSERHSDARKLLEELEECDLRAFGRDALIGPDLIDLRFSSVSQTLRAPAANPSPPPSSSALRTVERRRLTAVCCDFSLEGETATNDAASLESRDECLRAAFDSAVSVAFELRGRVAGVLGRQLLILFGYPRAEEDDARRAARAALKICATLDEAPAWAGGAIRARVAIALHSGPATAGVDSSVPAIGLVLGDTPHVASTLARLARPGQVVASPNAQDALGGRFDLAAVELSAGTTSATRIATIVRERDPIMAGSSADSDASRAPLVGRQHELQLLVERWERVSATGQCAMIIGEPGIGKTRLVRELRNCVAIESSQFVEARCSPDTQNNALFPVIDLLDRMLRLPARREPLETEARLVEELARHGLDVDAQLPLLLALFGVPLPAHRQLPDVSPPRIKQLTLSAIVGLLGAIAEKQSLVLLVEDLHWSDATTLELLSSLINESPSLSLFLVMTARPEFSPPFPTTGLLQLPIARLERAHVEAMLEGLLGSKPLPERVIEGVASRTDGVPLFVEELTRMLLDSKVLVESRDRYELVGELSEEEIPGSLRALLSARLDRMDRAKETAQLAAALGREFPIDVLCEASPLGEAGVMQDLDRLSIAGLLIRRRRAKTQVGIFKHALIRDAAYDSLTRNGRQQVHERLARTLVERFPDIVRTRPDLLALHFSAADQKALAVTHGQRAADQALEHSAFAEALSHATDVIGWSSALPADESVQAALLANGVKIHAMMATRGWTDPQTKVTADHSSALLQQLEQFSPQKIPTLWSLFAYYHTSSKRPEALAVAREMAGVGERLDHRGLRAAAATLLGIAFHADGDMQASERELELAISLHRPEEDRDDGPRNGLDSHVLAKTLLGHLRWFQGRDTAAAQLVTDALAWAREIGHVPSVAIGLLYGCQVFQHAGDRPTTAAMTGEILQLSERYGLPAYEGYAAIIDAWAWNDVARAERNLEVLATMGSHLCLSYYGSLVADNMARDEQWQPALARIEHCLELCARNGEHFYEPELLRRRGTYLLKLSPQASEARVSFERAAELARRQCMPRFEVLSRRALQQHFGSDEQSRLDELLVQYPDLKSLS